MGVNGTRNPAEQHFLCVVCPAIAFGTMEGQIKFIAKVRTYRPRCRAYGAEVRLSHRQVSPG